MAEMMGNKTALVFSTDRGFAPLAKGLVLSLLGQKGHARFSLNMVDIGCSAVTLAWMKKHGVNVAKFDREKYLGKIEVTTKPYQQAMHCRPFLGDIFPGSDIYVWCDADIWVQDISYLLTYVEVVEKNPEKVPISPLVDFSYGFSYENFSEFVGYNKTWYTDTYGPVVASTYCNKAVLSSGVFAMHRGNPLWKAWANEMAAILKRSYTSHFSSHLAEQTAFNYLLYSSGRFIPVSALHNYNCHIGRAVRSEKSTVQIDYAPFDSIGIIHLTYASQYIGKYLETGLLYERGSYLENEEIEKLRLINHY